MKYFGVITAIVAVAAFLRPDVERWWRRYRGDLWFKGKDKLEIGFGQFGPHIGLFGSLISFKADFCVGDMDLKVVRLKDSKTHSFNWQLIGALKLSQEVLRDSDVSASFWLRQDETRSVSLYFMDIETRSEFEKLMEPLKSDFFKFCQTKGIVLNGIAPDMWVSTFEDYRNQSPIPADVYHKLTRLHYWQEGSYQIELTLRCIYPSKTKRVVGRFAITAMAAETTETNVISTMNVSLGSPKGYLPQPILHLDWEEGEWA